MEREDRESLKEFLVRELNAQEGSHRIGDGKSLMSAFIEVSHEETLQLLRALDDFVLDFTGPLTMEDVSAKVTAYYEARGCVVRRMWSDGSGLVVRPRVEKPGDDGVCVSLTLAFGCKKLLCTLLPA